MARVNLSQRNSRDSTLRAALSMDTEADVYRDEADAGLTATQWQAIALLAGGTKQTEVAQTVGVTQETVSRWKNDPRFMAALNVAIRDSYYAVAGAVRDAATKAVTVLRESMDCDDPRVRLSAALSVLRLHGAYSEDIDNLPVTPAEIARRELKSRRYDSIGDTLL